jgi:hypothetical protein
LFPATAVPATAVQSFQSFQQPPRSSRNRFRRAVVQQPARPGRGQVPAPLPQDGRRPQAPAGRLPARGLRADGPQDAYPRDVYPQDATPRDACPQAPTRRTATPHRIRASGCARRTARAH